MVDFFSQRAVLITLASVLALGLVWLLARWIVNIIVGRMLFQTEQSFARTITAPP